MTHTLKQKIALAISLALVLALAVVAIVAGVALYAMATGHSRYQAQEYPGSAQHYALGARVISQDMGQWEAYFSQGTAEIRSNAVETGVVTLSVALDLVPKDADSDEPEPTDAQTLDDVTPECRVRMNMAVGQEIQGDRLMDAGYYDEATRTYEQASTTVAQCVPQGEPPRQQKQDTDEKAKKAREKQDEESGQGDEPPDSPGSGEGDEGEPAPPSTDDLKQEELERRAQEAERMRREALQRDNGLGDWDGENW